MTATAIKSSARFPGLSAWVTRLAAEYPGFDEFDLAGMVEEKTGIPMGREDFELVRSLYLRAKLRAWTPDED